MKKRVKIRHIQSTFRDSHTKISFLTKIEKGQYFRPLKDGDILVILTPTTHTQRTPNFVYKTLIGAQLWVPNLNLLSFREVQEFKPP